MNADFSNDVLLDADLFARVKAVHDKKTHKPKLTPEQETLLDESYKGFVRGGALLDEKRKRACAKSASACRCWAPRS